jgi:hypothetical protein
LDQSPQKGHHTTDYQIQLLTKLLNKCVSNPLTRSGIDGPGVISHLESRNQDVRQQTTALRKPSESIQNTRATPAHSTKIHSE